MPLRVCRWIKLLLSLVLVGDAYVNISRLSYVDKDNKKTYDDKENFEIVLRPHVQIIPHSQHQPGWIKTEMWITEFSIGFK